MLALLRNEFGEDIGSLDPSSLLELREAIDRAKGFHAFGATSREDYVHDPLRAQLIWHLGFWRVRQLREAGGLTPRDILPPGLYKKVCVVVADMCGFSSYVRGTEDGEVVRNNLTAFYSKARYQVINNGGLFYQFVGDEAIGLFGIRTAHLTLAKKRLKPRDAY